MFKLLFRLTLITLIFSFTIYYYEYRLESYSEINQQFLNEVFILRDHVARLETVKSSICEGD